MKRKFPLIAILLLLALVGCEKEISIPAEDHVDTLVIEGAIELNEKARVTVSLNQNFYDPFSLLNIYSYVLTDATVVLTDGTDYEELNLKTDYDYFPPFFYESKNMKGQPGKTYTLTVSWGNLNAYGISTMPKPTTLDSVWFIPSEDASSDSLGSIGYRYSDPDTAGNNHFITYSRDGIDARFYNASSPARTDKLVNGTTYNSSFSRGATNAEKALPEANRPWDYGYFVRGQEVEIKWSAMEQKTFDFWESLGNNNSGNILTTPSNVKSTVVGGFGVWAAYAPYKVTLVIP